MLQHHDVILGVHVYVHVYVQYHGIHVRVDRVHGHTPYNILEYCNTRHVYITVVDSIDGGIPVGSESQKNSKFKNL